MDGDRLFAGPTKRLLFAQCVTSPLGPQTKAAVMLRPDGQTWARRPLPSLLNSTMYVPKWANCGPWLSNGPILNTLMAACGPVRGPHEGAAKVQKATTPDSSGTAPAHVPANGRPRRPINRSIPSAEAQAATWTKRKAALRRLVLYPSTRRAHALPGSAGSGRRSRDQHVHPHAGRAARAWFFGPKPPPVALLPPRPGNKRICRGERAQSEAHATHPAARLGGLPRRPPASITPRRGRPSVSQSLLRMGEATSATKRREAPQSHESIQCADRPIGR